MHLGHRQAADPERVRWAPARDLLARLFARRAADRFGLGRQNGADLGHGDGLVQDSSNPRARGSLIAAGSLDTILNLPPDYNADGYSSRQGSRSANLDPKEDDGERNGEGMFPAKLIRREHQFAKVDVFKRAAYAETSICDLQSHSLSVLHLFGCSPPQACWTTVGLGIHSALDVGAHRENFYNGTTKSACDETWKSAHSIGLHGVVFDSRDNVKRALRHLVSEPIVQGRAFLDAHAGTESSHCCSSFTDLSCVCTSQAFQSTAQQCLTSNCTSADQQAALQLQQTECASATGASSTGAPPTSGVSSSAPTTSASASASIPTAGSAASVASSAFSAASSSASSVSSVHSSLASSASQVLSSARSSLSSIASSATSAAASSSTNDGIRVGFGEGRALSGLALGIVTYRRHMGHFDPPLSEFGKLGDYKSRTELATKIELGLLRNGKYSRLDFRTDLPSFVRGVSSPVDRNLRRVAFSSVHANSSNPAIAALTILAECNTLSSQNAQLWKHIAKHRTAYSHVNKGLERVRAERDAYRAKLQALGEDVDVDVMLKSSRDRENALRVSSSTSGLRWSEKPAPQTSSQPRADPVRYQSDDLSHRDELVSRDRPNHIVIVSHSPSTPNSTSAAGAPSDLSVTASASTSISKPVHPRPRSDSVHADISHTSRFSAYRALAWTLSSVDTRILASRPKYAVRSSLDIQSFSPHGHASTHAFARSRVSLPDEAKRYTTTMADSPLTSPRWREHSHSRTSSPAPSSHNPVAAQELDTDKPLARKDLSDGDKARGTAAEDFTLPPFMHPSTPITSKPSSLLRQQQQAQMQALGYSQAVTIEQNHHVDTPTTPTANSYNPHMSFNSTSSTITSIIPPQSGHPALRALPLLPHDLPRTRIQVTNSTMCPNNRGKDVLSFIVSMDPGNGKEPWIEKLYSDVLGLDQRARARAGKNIGKKIANLPDGKLWRDHAPSKVDQRKMLIRLPIKYNDKIITFLTSDIIKGMYKPVSHEGYKEGYLTKHGKNFDGCKTQFFVLQAPMLEY
ncbi:hypothetical protein EW146_g1037 [Bondarzewia mesenterica]|uniref:CFEM domain-containing protein n=1 Tax=Bondarzewia mesenterica TaxID=1095465 RepID=A0A4S4M563_9AGAM|nr:hypothetical protein EW146_g1037 [Bondarzewia mesenterica]